jgi:FixJ family two-component response regulator
MLSGVEPRVFVVDDDASVRKAVARLLRTHGFAIESFASAQDFMAHGDLPDGPSCLVLDIRMPELDGLGLQERIGRAGLDVAIVFLTGHGDVPTTVRAMKAGAVDFLEKPFEADDLVAAVRRALAVSERTRVARTERDDLEARLSALTPREREVLALVAAGLTNKVIAVRLGTTEKTIKVHRGRVMAKMNAPSLAELVRMVEKLNLRA